jgi:hypothetical protein
LTSPKTTVQEESLPSRDTITLTKETCSGFIDRANRFRVDSDGAFLADRWRSDFFHVRSGDQEGEATAQSGGQFSQASLGPEAPREVDEGHFTMRIETVRGFVDRGGRFVGSGEGASLGDCLVSDWFNVREAEPAAQNSGSTK